MGKHPAREQEKEKKRTEVQTKDQHPKAQNSQWGSPKITLLVVLI
jgi:hypothetical protein